LSTLADQVGNCAVVLAPLYQRIKAHVMAATRIHGDDLSGLEVMKANPLPANVDFWAGVIDVKSTICETAEQVAQRIEKILPYVPANRLGVTTDCGLILLQRYIAKDKLHALVEGTKLVRAKLGAS
jgi:5-methyltetrahydropteroyltriglutamate--homocysteine methyltransferase